LKYDVPADQGVEINVMGVEINVMKDLLTQVGKSAAANEQGE